MIVEILVLLTFTFLVVLICSHYIASKLPTFTPIYAFIVFIILLGAMAGKWLNIAFP